MRSPTLDLAASRAKCHSIDVIADNDLPSYKTPLSRSFLSDGLATDSSYSSLGRSTSALPKKYGSTVGGLEPKSVEYYEEILSPRSNPEYLSPRDTCHSPLLDLCENGCNHNGNFDLPSFSTDQSRASYTDAERDSKLLAEQKR